MCCNYGMIAQEVADVAQTMPQKVIVNHYDDYIKNPDTEETLGLSYESFIPLLIKAVQDQEKKIQTLEEEKQIVSTKLDEIKALVGENTLPVSSSKELLLHSDSIDAIESFEVYKDGLNSEQNTKEVIYNL